MMNSLMDFDDLTYFRETRPNISESSFCTRGFFLFQNINRGWRVKGGRASRLEITQGWTLFPAKKSEPLFWYCFCQRMPHWLFRCRNNRRWSLWTGRIHSSEYFKSHVCLWNSQSSTPWGCFHFLYCISESRKLKNIDERQKSYLKCCIDCWRIYPRFFLVATVVNTFL